MKIHNVLKRQVNNRLNQLGFDGSKMFRKPGSAWADLFNILHEFGMTSDGLPQFRGDSGTERIDYRYHGEAYEGTTIENSIIYFAWHEMQSGSYEVVAYLS